GGTGGHFFPAVAVVQAAAQIGEVRACFVGRQDKIEGRLAPTLGYEFLPLPLSAFTSWRLARSYTFPLLMLRSLERLSALVKTFRPHIVLTTGAYVGVPAGIVARWYRLPLIVLEVNVIPGRAVRFLARWASTIVTGYRETVDVFAYRLRNRVQWFGVPLRQEFLAPPSPTEARLRLGLMPELPVVAVMGGSLGAARLNAIAQRLVRAVERGICQLVWQHGERFTVPQPLPSGVVAQAFFMEPAVVLAAADCVVARAGGMTIAELCGVGRAAILVPYPGAVQQHQFENARWMEQHGAAVCITDDRAEEEVPSMLEQLLQDSPRRLRMAEAARLLAQSDAAYRIARLAWGMRGQS
ncbi:MAG: UDP-N-acetylglucosamine--N-acetylmuramyl-(pentapeptide) pyrophosphoryl-undecaprenol N-acetylglucosamine transferase, partial [Candidatus Kapabacteria bacterium]|nr:UDP-N-acetylglucosamine--N-acetylmuramyl-(pentapeptide) pyrophosphoryl-undecaprenol N-acetylglucosamine transferase [Candidatus Kapabacteria bacterium]MDW7996821.1 UDP-N-acetylglucosamine--N-acetylmuramyl-(pentapeptide) pyrophosphoryl-undecaprenol N-acetylglucosamine transferase [Bacteroidota bacterium]